MARKFSFNIDKPVFNTGATTDADKLSDSIYDELLSRFPNSGDSADQLTTMLGLLYPGGATQKEIVFDRGLQKQSKQRIYVLPFGDGYEQRAKNGINTKEETYSIQMKNKNWYEIELISAFFDVITPDSFTITLQREDIKVVCESYSITSNEPDIQSISTTLRRVYEP